MSGICKYVNFAVLEELHRKYFDAHVGQANFKQVVAGLGPAGVQAGMRKDGQRHPGCVGIAIIPLIIPLIIATYGIAIY